MNCCKFIQPYVQQTIINRPATSKPKDPDEDVGQVSPDGGPAQTEEGQSGPGRRRRLKSRENRTSK